MTDGRNGNNGDGRRLRLGYKASAEQFGPRELLEFSIAAERHGVAYLQPLVQLVGELTDAQSSAVRGAQPDTNHVNTAIAGV